MAKQINLSFLLLILQCRVILGFCALKDLRLVLQFADLVKTTSLILFTCSDEGLKNICEEIMDENYFLYPVQLYSNYSLDEILDRRNYGRTSIVVDTKCPSSRKLLKEASNGRYFNKTFQWLLLNEENKDLDDLLPYELDYIGPNAQLTFVNFSQEAYHFWDIHSKGRHLKCRFEVHLIGKLMLNETNLEIGNWIQVNDVFKLQSIKYRDQFNGLTLRGASVIDQENITTNEQIEKVLSRPTKDSGVAAFVKYHYELLILLRDRFNFTVNFRNSRGWAGRLGNSFFRLGFLGIIKRNEADIGASGAFNRKNRFAEFDTIHQSWKFETAFLYRFTPDLDAHSKSGNFLAPFDDQVWCCAIATVIAICFIWRLIAWFTESRYHKKKEMSFFRKRIKRNPGKICKKQFFKPQPKFKTFVDVVGNLLKIGTGNEFQEHGTPLQSENINESSLSVISLNTFGAVCQQGMDPIPKGLPIRTIITTVFIFSLVMYNYYTSSVVGGLLSSTERGPSTVDEIVASPLKVSFEDIGYYKVLFRENKSPIVTSLIRRKLSGERKPNEVPIYTHIEEAVPHLKAGGFAFHCEVVDAYPEISKLFDANEICDLRVVSGLMTVEIMSWNIHKNSQYTELFKTAMCRVREIGLIERLLRQRQPKKPACQSLYTVYPVSLSGVLSAFVMLLGGVVLSLLILGVELCVFKYRRNNTNWFD